MSLLALLNLPAFVSLVLWPSRHVAAVERRMAEGDDSYFEEQRSYREWAFLRDPKRLRLMGVAGILACLLGLAIDIFGR